MRLNPDLTAELLNREEASFALIYLTEPSPEADVVVAYTSQATSGFLEIYMIEVNTDYVKDKSFQFERYWARAWSEAKSLSYLKDLLRQYDQ